jgi:hypothetical protein
MIQNPFPMMVLAAGVIACAPATAQTSPAQTIRLSPEQLAKVRDSGTEAVAPSASNLSGGSLDKGIHGEVGMMIGTNGSRGVFGAAAIPLGQNAGAVISFEDSRFGHR